MEKSMLSIYMSQVEKIPLLSAKEEKELLEKAVAGSKSARNKIVNSNLRFVVKLAYKYKDRGVDFEDLICEGNSAILKAIDKMDPSKNVRFITYASFWINQYMKAAIYATGRSVAIPQNRPEELKNQNWMSSSLDKPLSDTADSATILDTLCDTESALPFDALFKDAMYSDIQAALDSLSKKERFVITRHYGLDGGEPMSLRDIGEFLDMSREGIRQIEARARGKLSQNENVQIWGDQAA